MGKVVNLREWQAQQKRIANGYRLAEWNRKVLEKKRRMAALDKIQDLVRNELGMDMLQFGERCLDVYVRDGISPTRYQRKGQRG